MKILQNLRNCLRRKDLEKNLYGKLCMRVDGAIVLVTYKYLKTDGRVRRNRFCSQQYFVSARGKSKKPGFLASGCV